MLVSTGKKVFLFQIKILEYNKFIQLGGQTVLLKKNGEHVLPTV